METYARITEQIRQFGTYVKIMIGVGLALQFIFLLIFMKIVYPKEKVVEKETIVLKNLTLLEVCEIGLLSLRNNHPNELLLTTELIQQIKKDNFKLPSDEMTLFKKISFNECQVVIQDQKGKRNFHLQLLKNPQFPFFYKIFDIQETKLEKEVLL